MRTYTLPNSIIRLPTVLEIVGFSRATLYAQIKQGVFPKPVNIGSRSVGWVVDEVHTVLNARIAGVNNNELVSLVSKMYQERQSRFL